MTFNANWQPGFDKQIDDRNYRQNPIQDQELLCACTGTSCEGICKEQHLHRPRYAISIKPKGKESESAVREQWAEKCPEAYYKTQNPVHYRA